MNDINNKYGGQLIFATSDEFGPVEVVDMQQKLRSLHFGNRTQQATMFLYNPIVLVHKYTQAMLTPLCWYTPKRVLVLGLGAGSLVKFLWHHFDAVHVDAVELRPRVTQIAREYFSLPEKQPRLQVHHVPAEDYLNKVQDDTDYDLILVDLFLTVSEKDISVGVTPQLEKLRQLLTKGGSMTINIIGENHVNYPGLNELQALFGNRLYRMSVDSSNIVLLARHQDLPKEADIDFTSKERKYGLPFRQYFNKLEMI